MLSEGQKEILTWLVAQHQERKLEEEFTIFWASGGPIIAGFQGGVEKPNITRGSIDALYSEGMLICREGTHAAVTCTLTGDAFHAVANNFNAPDTSFVRFLTPLSDITNLDSELKGRCLPILGAGSTEPMLWDSAVRTALVILEERMRKVGGVQDGKVAGVNLVNHLFSQNGLLAAKYPNQSELQAHRDLYAGVIGAVRNVYQHKIVDPTPERGGVMITFIDLLLKTLDELGDDKIEAET